MQQQTQLRAGPPNAPQKARPPPQSRTRPLLQSRSLNLTTPSANWRTSAMKTQHRRSARGKMGNITPRSAGRTKSTLSPCQSTSLYPTKQDGRAEHQIASHEHVLVVAVYRRHSLAREMAQRRAPQWRSAFAKERPIGGARLQLRSRTRSHPLGLQWRMGGNHPSRR